MTDPHDVPTEIDRALVRRFQGGDRHAFVELMERHERRVYNLAYRMLGRTEDARDAAQDAFLSCYRNLERFRGDSSFGTWLYRIATNACYDALRKRPLSVSMDALTSEPPAADHADRAVAAADVHRALQAVPPEFRSVLVLFELQDLSVGDIAEALGIPVGTVKSRLHRGRAALGRALSGTADPSTARPLPRTPAPGAGEARPVEHRPGEPRPAPAPSNPSNQ
jgi:RNA polymerase sigma-70 factor (ECF subfamily)